mmetsp:Transcript_26689/g.59304  ORF Transcript_26689/g.59304 Transcript_26689/m.59304 type:complete len:241 (+) Transcript_26689:1357-2079(+)
MQILVTAGVSVDGAGRGIPGRLDVERRYPRPPRRVEPYDFRFLELRRRRGLEQEGTYRVPHALLLLLYLLIDFLRRGLPACYCWSCARLSPLPICLLPAAAVAVLLCRPLSFAFRSVFSQRINEPRRLIFLLRNEQQHTPVSPFTRTCLAPVIFRPVRFNRNRCLLRRWLGALLRGNWVVEKKSVESVTMRFTTNSSVLRVPLNCLLSLSLSLAYLWSCLSLLSLSTLLLLLSSLPLKFG